MRRLTLLPALSVLSMLFAADVTAATLTLEWDSPTDGKTVGHVVVYGPAPGTYVSRLDVGAATKASIPGLVGSGRYCFAVQAYNVAGGMSARSAEVCGIAPVGAPLPTPVPAPSPTPIPPKTPTPAPQPPPPNPEPGPVPGLTAVVRESRYLDIAWSRPASVNPSAYRVEVGPASGQTAISTLTTELASTFVMADFPALTYSVRVRPIMNGVIGEPSDEVMVNVTDQPTSQPPDSALPQCTAAPGAPLRLVATASGGHVQLSWLPGGGVATTGYVLQVGSAPGYQDLMTVPLGPTAGLAAAAANGTYALRLVGTNACGSSTWGPETILQVGTPNATLPGMPEGLAQHVSGTQVALSWQSPSTGGPVSRYVLEVETAAGPLAFDTGTSAIAFVHPNTPAGQYVVRVRAGNEAGLGPASAPVTVTVP